MRVLVAAAFAVLAAGCVVPPESAKPVTPAAERPAEKALLAGIRAYDDGQYAESEKHLAAAAKAGLVSPKDRATVNKYLAFIYCTSNRHANCEAAFRAARQADPSFALSKSEAGHPQWGPVYKRVQ